MPKVTMLFGPVGAGKTTLARELEREGAVRLSLDEWTISASGSRVDVDWNVVQRTLTQLMRLWPQVVAAGADVVLDLAFWERSRRDETRRMCADLGVDVELVWVDCVEHERRSRCLERGSDHSSYLIDEAGFDWITDNRVIEALGADEAHTRIDTSTTEQSPA